MSGNSMKKLDYLPGAVLVYRADETQEILYANQNVIELFGCNDIDDFKDYTGNSFTGLVSDDELEGTLFNINKQINDETSNNYDHVFYHIQTKQGEKIYIEDYGKLVDDEDFGLVYYAFLVLPKVKLTEASRDEVTGLLNMRYLLNIMDKKRQTNSKQLLDKTVKHVAIYFNILNFKMYNRYYGFEQGNNCLKEIGDILTDVFKVNTIARFSDDHFVVLYDGNDEIENIKEVHGRVAALDDRFQLYIDAGVYYSDYTNPTSLDCDLAKLACDSIKNSLTDYYAVYSDKLKEVQELRKYITDNIDKAIKNGYIKIYFQPVVRALTGELCSMEALTRWIDPEHGFLSPGDFIPILEENNLIYKLDLFVINEVAKHLKEQNDNNKPIVPVSLNISRMDFAMCDPFAEVEKVVTQYGLVREWITVEITESAIATDAETIQSEIEKFHKGGFDVWMDDFGSGYSSLNTLKDFDFDEIKIDMAFLRNMNDRSKKILSSAVRMAKQIGIHTLAEGVETKEHVDFLREIGCEKIQGYFFGKPAPYEEVMHHIKDQGIEVETQTMKAFYEKVGMVDFMTDRSLALFYDDGKKFKTIFVNREYWNDLESREAIMAMSDDIINSADSMLRPSIRNLAEKAKKSSKDESIDLVYNGRYYRLRMKVIANSIDGWMHRVSLEDITFNEIKERTSALNSVVRNVATLYESIYHVDFATDKAELVYTNRDDQSVGDFYESFTKAHIVQHLEFYDGDREKYENFLTLDTITRRILEVGEAHVSDIFRIKGRDGNYYWKEIIIIALPSPSRTQFLLCIKPSVLEGKADMTGLTSKDSETSRNNNQLKANPAQSCNYWKELMKKTDIKFFWKDKERRFLGASQSFLDYYNIKSIDEIIGKTDEDLKWHIDDINYKSDEEAVLATGKPIYHSAGQNIINGVIHNVSATKVPMYDNGKISGIIGYFIDIDEVLSENEKNFQELHIDTSTGVMNSRGFLMSCIQYEDNYRIHNQNYKLVILEIKGYHHILKSYGKEVAEHMMQKVASILQKHSQRGATISRIGSWHFAILEKGSNFTEMDNYVQNAIEEIMAVRTIDGFRATLYVNSCMILGSDQESSIGFIHLIDQIFSNINADKIENIK
jgi:diguanylate cyclase (GGDEF)-like protein